MDLTKGFVNRFYVVESIDASSLISNKLKKMSVTRGSVIKLLRKHEFFSYLIEVEENRIAFDKEIAEKIKVIPYV